MTFWLILPNKWKNVIFSRIEVKKQTVPIVYCNVFIAYNIVHYLGFPMIPRLRQQHYYKLRFGSYNFAKKGGILSIYLSQIDHRSQIIYLPKCNIQMLISLELLGRISSNFHRLGRIRVLQVGKVGCQSEFGNPLFIACENGQKINTFVTIQCPGSAFGFGALGGLLVSFFSFLVSPVALPGCRLGTVGNPVTLKPVASYGIKNNHLFKTNKRFKIIINNI